MSDHEPAEVRRVLKQRGHEVPARGVLSAANIALYEQIISEDGEYQGGVSAADFAAPGSESPLPGMDDIDLGPAFDDLEDQAPGGAGDPGEERAEERTPRAAGGPPAGARARGFLRGDRGGGGKARAPRRRRPKTKREWIPTGPLIERIWGEMAHAARKAPPLQRVMAAQAPMVGIVLQDATRGTIIDRGPLKWMARGEDRLEAVNATVGSLLWTAGIMRFGGFDVEPVTGADGRPVITEDGPLVRPVMDPETGLPAWNEFTQVMIGGLRLSLMSWLRVGQRHADEIIARAEELDELGDQADALIRFILSPPVPGQSFREMQREARQRAGVFLHGEADGQGDDDGGQGDELGGAADPAPAAAGHAPGAVVDLARRGEHPYPPMDPRTLGFTPPDAHVASQVVPRAPMPQA